MRRLLSCLVAVLALGACASGSPEEADEVDGRPEVDLPAGWQLLEGDGALLGVPAHWVALDLEGGELDEVLDELAARDPDLGELITSQVRVLLGRGAVLLAVEQSDGALAASVNVVRLPGRVPEEPEALEATAMSGIGALGGEVLATEAVELPAGPALRVRYTASLPGPGGEPVEVHGVQHHVLGASLHVVTTSLPDPAAEDLADDLAATLRTW